MGNQRDKLIINIRLQWTLNPLDSELSNDIPSINKKSVDLEVVKNDIVFMTYFFNEIIGGYAIQ